MRLLETARSGRFSAKSGQSRGDFDQLRDQAWIRVLRIGRSSAGVCLNDGERVAAVWEFETSDLFGEAERAALRLALAMGQAPNGVGPEHFVALRKHYDDEQIVERVATDVERPLADVAEAVIGGRGWEP